jgi:hypothetical protein
MDRCISAFPSDPFCDSLAFTRDARCNLGTRLKYTSNPSFDDPGVLDGILAALIPGANIPSRATSAVDRILSFEV